MAFNKTELLRVLILIRVLVYLIVNMVNFGQIAKEIIQ